MSSLPGYRPGLSAECCRDGRDVHQVPQLRDSLSGLSVRPGLTRPLCWRCIANMMAGCWVLIASHEGPVSARLLASRGFDQIGAIEASREPSPDPYSEAMIRPSP